jgi:hypothetical protein
MRWLGTAGAAIACLVGAGCAVPAQVRQDARLMSVYTQRVQREAQQFADLRDAIAKARTRNVGSLEESALRAEQELGLQAVVWGMADDQQRADLYQGIVEGTTLVARQQDSLAAQRAEHQKAVDAAHGGVELRQEKLAASAQALAQLAEKPDLKAKLGFYIAFFKGVREELEADHAAAADQAERAVDEASRAAPAAEAGH